MPIFIDEPLGGVSPDVIHDRGMRAGEARSMLLVAKAMGLRSKHSDNKDGTFEIIVYTGTSETSNLFWKRTEMVSNFFGIKPVIESVVARIKGERSRG